MVNTQQVLVLPFSRGRYEEVPRPVTAVSYRLDGLVDGKKVPVRRRRSSWLSWLPDDLTDWWCIPVQRRWCPWLADDLDDLHLMVCPCRRPPRLSTSVSSSRRTPRRKTNSTATSDHAAVQPTTRRRRNVPRRTTAGWNSRSSLRLLGPDDSHSSGLQNS